MNLPALSGPCGLGDSSKCGGVSPSPMAPTYNMSLPTSASSGGLSGPCGPGDSSKGGGAHVIRTARGRRIVPGPPNGFRSGFVSALTVPYPARCCPSAGRLSLAVVPCRGPCRLQCILCCGNCSSAPQGIASTFPEALRWMASYSTPPKPNANPFCFIEGGPLLP